MQPISLLQSFDEIFPPSFLSTQIVTVFVATHQVLRSFANVLTFKDKYLRSVAEFRNLQDRTKRDVDAARNFAIQRFATDLLDSIDNLDRALGAVPEEALKSDNKELQSLHSGLKMTESILLSTLKKHGLERFDPIEQDRKFDPKVDEAVFMAPMQGKENGDVLMTQSKGFVLNGRVLRAAKVGVVKNGE